MAGHRSSRCSNKLTPSLRDRYLLPSRKLRHLHAELVPQFALRAVEDGFELTRALLAEDFGADVCAADGESGVLA